MGLEPPVESETATKHVYVTDGTCRAFIICMVTKLGTDRFSGTNVAEYTAKGWRLSSRENGVTRFHRTSFGRSTAVRLEVR